MYLKAVSCTFQDEHVVHLNNTDRRLTYHFILSNIISQWNCND